MYFEDHKLPVVRSSSDGRRRQGSTTRLFAGALATLVALACLACQSASTASNSSFTYVHVIGTGDPPPSDPNDPDFPMDEEIAACDVGSLTEQGLMANVCSFDGDKNSDGGVYIEDGMASRSFRREDPLPGQEVGFENAIIPFGYPALHPETGDTYVTVFFNDLEEEHPVLSNLPGGAQEGVYLYDRSDNVMRLIVDTTTGPELHVGASWTDFSNNVAVSEAGAFFVGNYASGDSRGQGIYHYAGGGLTEIISNPNQTVGAGQGTIFPNLRGVVANATTVLFVAESIDCAVAPQFCKRTVHAYDLASSSTRTVIESGTPVPDGGTFLDFAVEPQKGIFHHSMAINEEGEIVLVATFERSGATHQGVFLMKNAGGAYDTELILESGTEDLELLGSEIKSFNTVAINRQGEVSFTVSDIDPSVDAEGQGAPQQGLIFYRDDSEGLRSVFKAGDTFLVDPAHPPEETSAHGGMVAGSQALSSSEVPQIYFRHAYMYQNMLYSRMVLATLHPLQSP